MYFGSNFKCNSDDRSEILFVDLDAQSANFKDIFKDLQEKFTNLASVVCVNN